MGKYDKILAAIDAYLSRVTFEQFIEDSQAIGIGLFAPPQIDEMVLSDLYESLITLACVGAEFSDGARVDVRGLGHGYEAAFVNSNLVDRAA